MTHQKNLLGMPSPLNFIRVAAGASCGGKASGPIVADWHEQFFFTRNRSRYQREISRDDTSSATGELIVGFQNFVNDR
jgi:hypothetical protein